MKIKIYSEKICTKIKKLTNTGGLSRYKRDLFFWPVLIVLCIWGLLAKSDRIETVFFAAIAAFFTYKSYISSEERFRLDLFEQRFKIYEELIVFCSSVLAIGGIKPGASIGDQYFDQVKRLYDAADNSFRGLGYHKATALFGEDVRKLLENINSTYSWLIAFNRRPPVGTPGYDTWPDQWAKHITFLHNICTDLPKMLRPYVYFGDVKNTGLAIIDTIRDTPEGDHP
jgi:hypothetical protein